MYERVSVSVRVRWRTLPTWSARHMLPGTANRHRWRWERRRPGRSEGLSQVEHTHTHTQSWKHTCWWETWPLQKNVNSLRKDIFRLSAAVEREPSFLLWAQRFTDLLSLSVTPPVFYIFLISIFSLLSCDVSVVLPFHLRRVILSYFCVSVENRILRSKRKKAHLLWNAGQKH